ENVFSLESRSPVPSTYYNIAVVAGCDHRPLRANLQITPQHARRDLLIAACERAAYRSRELCGQDESVLSYQIYRVEYPLVDRHIGKDSFRRHYYRRP